MKHLWKKLCHKGCIEKPIDSVRRFVIIEDVPIKHILQSDGIGTIVGSYKANKRREGSLILFMDICDTCREGFLKVHLAEYGGRGELHRIE